MFGVFEWTHGDVLEVSPNPGPSIWVLDNLRNVVVPDIFMNKF